MTARVGRYSVSGVSAAADGRRFGCEGNVTLHHDSTVTGESMPLSGLSLSVACNRYSQCPSQSDTVLYGRDCMIR